MTNIPYEDMELLCRISDLCDTALETIEETEATREILEVCDRVVRLVDDMEAMEWMEDRLSW